MDELPTTIIGLIAFIMLGFGYAIKYLSDQNKNTIDTFMTYIKTKNGNYERSAAKFADTMEKVAKEHKESIDELISRLPARNQL